MSAPADWTLAPAELDAFLGDKGHNAQLGIRYHAHAEDWVELILPWSAALVDDAGVGALATAALMTLIDNTAGCAIYPKRGGFLPQVTLDLRADHLRPIAPNSSVICRAECVRLSGSTALTRGLAYETSPADPVCHVTATFMLL